jgi:DMSO/TMAO reductase YedYZ molybdopterin-dependent catalytic subunit
MRDDRLPPGQRWIDDPVIYDIAAVAPLDAGTARLALSGAVARPAELVWKDLLGLPQRRIVRDFHCVTKWSVKDIAWEGVAARTLIDLVEPAGDVSWVLAVGREGYATSVPYEHFAREGSLVAMRMNGELLPPEHGAPLRLVIPSLYAWKSAKYLVSLRFLASQERGFWEQRGYHDVGDPWREERFHGVR